jgi:lysophospholipase L1-like esterase
LWRAGKNLTLTAVVLIMLFAVLEAGFRIWRTASARSPRPNTLESTWVQYDEDLVYRLKPNFGAFNEHGLYDHPLDKASGRFRVLVLGDSVAFGGRDVNDTIAGRVEGILNTYGALAPTDLINAAVPGYTNYQELVYLKKYGLEFRPQLVGVIFVFNDLHKFLHDFHVNNGRLDPKAFYDFTPEVRREVGGPLYRWARKSVFLRWLRSSFRIADRAARMYRQRGFSFDYRPDFYTAWRDEPWKSIEAQLREMVDLGKRASFRVFLVAVPFGEQLRKDYQARDFAYVVKPQRKLQEICGRLGIPYLDLFPVVDGEAHMTDGIHLNEAGRAVAAVKIAEFLREQQLVPRRKK